MRCSCVKAMVSYVQVLGDVRKEGLPSNRTRPGAEPGSGRDSYYYYCGVDKVLLHLLSILGRVRIKKWEKRGDATTNNKAKKR